MTALHTLEDQRTRGSARLLATWHEPGVGTRPAGPLDALAVELAAADAGEAAELWARSVRRHGGRPLPPRATTDGVPHTDLMLGAARDRQQQRQRPAVSIGHGVLVGGGTDA